jgi:hypothetical protein
MSMNPKTYDLISRYLYREVLERANEHLSDPNTDSESGVLIPQESKSDALSLIHALNRYRAAARVQLDIFDWDGLEIKMFDEGERHFVQIRDRVDTIGPFDLVDPISKEVIERLEID